MLFNLSVHAQVLSKKNKTENKNSPTESSAGMKKYSTESENINASNPIDTNRSSPDNSANKRNEEIQLSISKEANDIQLETIPFDYNQMPHDVQAKIDKNKAAGRNGLDGIAKGYTVEIKSCINSELASSNLAYLKSQNDFIRIEFVSTGIIRIIVTPEFDSVVMKEIMKSAGMDFNFLHEIFLIVN